MNPSDEIVEERFQNSKYQEYGSRGYRRNNRDFDMQEFLRPAWEEILR